MMPYQITGDHYSRQEVKTPTIVIFSTFTFMTLRYDVVIAKQKQIYNQPANSFHTRYHTIRIHFANLIRILRRV